MEEKSKIFTNIAYFKVFIGSYWWCNLEDLKICLIYLKQSLIKNGDKWQVYFYDIVWTYGCAIT